MCQSRFGVTGESFVFAACRANFRQLAKIQLLGFDAAGLNSDASVAVCLKRFSVRLASDRSERDRLDKALQMLGVRS